MAKRIVLDAMGGDHAPENPIDGALAALEALEDGFEIVLVGDEARIRRVLADRNASTGRIHVHHAPDVVGMDEPAAAGLRKKRRSSISVGLELQKRGEADAFLSAGNTGAVMASALVTLGRIESISRPAIVTIFPTAGLPCLILDVGANVDCKPRHLLQFAVMGHVYARDVLDRGRPRIGLLSIGQEPGKGNDLTIAAHTLLAGSGLHFVGNVEGRHILEGAVDVVVCDGFVGNVVLKFGESFLDFLGDVVREEVRERPLAAMGALLMRPAFRSIRRRLDYAEYGGAPLLGVDGVVIIGHGGSSAKALCNAVRVAFLAVERDLAGHVEEAMRKFDRDGSGGSSETPIGEQATGP